MSQIPTGEVFDAEKQYIPVTCGRSWKQNASFDKDVRFLRNETLKVGKRPWISSPVTSARFLLTRTRIILLNPSNSTSVVPSISFLEILWSISHCQDRCSLKHWLQPLSRVYCRTRCFQPALDGYALLLIQPLPLEDRVISHWNKNPNSVAACFLQVYCCCFYSYWFLSFGLKTFFRFPILWPWTAHSYWTTWQEKDLCKFVSVTGAC